MTPRDLLDRDPIGPTARRQVAAQRRNGQDLGLAIAVEALLLFAALAIAVIGAVAS